MHQIGVEIFLSQPKWPRTNSGILRAAVCWNIKFKTAHTTQCLHSVSTGSSPSASIKPHPQWHSCAKSRSVAGFNPPRLSLHPGPPSPSPRTGDFNPATKAQDYRISPSLAQHDQRSNISARWTRWTRWRCRLVYANQAFWRRSSLKGGDVITSLWC